MPSKLKLEDCQEYAEEKGGECLSDTYENNTTNMKWKCIKGHFFTRNFKTVKKGLWCDICNIQKNKPYTIEDIVKYCKENGFICLTKDYKNNKEKMNWKCMKCSYEWKVCFGSLGGCPKCSGKAPLKLEEPQEYAKEKGGQCLSKKYINNLTPLEWKCSKGHKWKSAFGYMKSQNSWCNKCAGHKPTTIKDCQEYAKERGGQCLSVEYDTYSKTKFVCDKKHIFEVSFKSMKHRNSWCSICNPRTYSKVSIEWLKYIEEEENIIIEHAENIGEYTIKIPDEYKDFNSNFYKVDGFNRETNTIYEYHESFYHGHPSKYLHTDLHPQSKRMYGILLKKTLYKEIVLRKLGYNYICIWDFEYYQ